MNLLTTQAIVLKRTPYGEADKILTVLTPHYGKVSLIAKGVRKAKSKNAGGVELFTISDITYLETKRELKTLVSAQAREYFKNIVQNLTSTQTAYNMLAAVTNFTDTLCEPSYFTVTEQSLRALHDGCHNTVVFVWFGVRLLDMSGQGIQTIVQGTEGSTYTFDYAAMSFTNHPEGTFTPNHIKVLRLCLANSLEKLEKVQDIQRYCLELQQIIGNCLKYNTITNL